MMHAPLLGPEFEERALQPRICHDDVFGCAIPFWREIFGGNEGALALSSGFRVGKRLHGVSNRTFNWPEESLLAASWVTKEATYGRDIYMQPVLKSRDRFKLDTKTSVIAADIDEGSLDDLPSPTAVVQTSNGRRQLYWKLDEPITGRVASQIASRIQTIIGNRPSDTTFMRVPGVLNHKYHDVWVTIEQRSGHTYTPGHLAALLGMTPDELVAPMGSGNVLSWIRDSTSSLARGVKVTAAGAAALLLVAGSLGLRAAQFQVPDLTSESRASDPLRLRFESVDPQFEKVHLGSFAAPVVVARSPVRVERARSRPLENEGKPDDDDDSGPVGETSTTGMDAVRSTQQRILDLAQELTR